VGAAGLEAQAVRARASIMHIRKSVFFIISPVMAAEGSLPVCKLPLALFTWATHAYLYAETKIVSIR
jgi:hypothetical protein